MIHTHSIARNSYLILANYVTIYLLLIILVCLDTSCLFTIVIVQITGHPISMAVNINSTTTLSCKAAGSGPIRYQWRRVNGEISSDRAEGVNTSTLTISQVQQDEDEYYCVASNGGVDGLQYYSDISHRAIVTIYGKGL